jgi:hypothetical protein
LPELRKRGLFWDDYIVKGGTYRENISAHVGQKVPPDDHPASRYHWKADVEKEDHVIPPEPESEQQEQVQRQIKPVLKRKRDVPNENGSSQRRKSARISS